MKIKKSLPKHTSKHTYCLVIEKMKYKILSHDERFGPKNIQPDILGEKTKIIIFIIQSSKNDQVFLVSEEK